MTACPGHLVTTADPTTRLELFPEDLDRLIDFYVGVLGFELVDDRRRESEPYVYMVRGAVRIGALKTWAPVDISNRSLPNGAEIVIEVEDLGAERDRIIAAGHPLAEDLIERPWGLTDFRVFDPAGYYLRFTTRPVRA
jgi:lactoylglutathione lyase